MSLNRRTFLGSTALATYAALINSNVMAASSTPLTRYDAHSVDGKKMLEKYATAVAQMKALPDGNPQSWTFQWYTHSVPTVRNGVATNKAIEMMRVFPAPSTAKLLADAAWETCQAHHASDVEDYFLPWHRLYLEYFEAIIRNVLADNTFTLPYWDYTNPAAGVHGILPEEFRKPNDPLFKSLYVADRNPGVNAGQPIQNGLFVDPLNLDDLLADTYQGATGFCNSLDGNLHGTVHGLVGTLTNMGRVPFAARDPIFWLHHCNLDRLWASWNAAGNSNPAGFNQKFTFANGDGTKVEGNVGSVMKMADMDYKYDRLEGITLATPPNEANGNTVRIVASSTKPTEAAAEPIKLGAGRVKVTLDMLPAADNANPRPFLEHVQGMKPKQHLSVVFKGIQAKEAPGTVYQVFLDLPEQPTPEQYKEHYIGTLNFFDAANQDQHAQDNPVASKPVPMRITKVAKALRDKNLLGAKPTIVIIPQGTPAEGAMPTIKEVQVLEH